MNPFHATLTLETLDGREVPAGLSLTQIDLITGPALVDAVAVKGLPTDVGGKVGILFPVFQPPKAAPAGILFPVFVGK